VDNRSLAERIAEMTEFFDFEPKLRIKIEKGCSFLPWVRIDGDCYVINGSREYKGMMDEESFAFQEGIIGPD
jgi:hypothetical protein